MRVCIYRMRKGGEKERGDIVRGEVVGVAE